MPPAEKEIKVYEDSFEKELQTCSNYNKQQ